jgi:acyl-coenzyme A thioesterase PaaI-like protein
VGLDVDWHSWKERRGDTQHTLISVFSFTLNHTSRYGNIHGGKISSALDRVLACYCHSEGAEPFPLTKTSKVEFIKPMYPDEALFAQVIKTSPPRDSTGNKGKGIWAQASIETIRDNKVITLAKAEALFILHQQLPPEPNHKIVLSYPDRSYKRMSQEL